MRIRYPTEAELEHDLDRGYKISKELKQVLRDRMVLSEETGLPYFIDNKANLVLDTYTALEDKIGNLAGRISGFLQATDINPSFKEKAEKLKPKLKAMLDELIKGFRNGEIITPNIPILPDLIYNLKELADNYLTQEKAELFSRIYKNLFGRGSERKGQTFDYGNEDKGAKKLIDLLEK